MLFNGGLRSLGPGLAGALIGAVYLADVLYIASALQVRRPLNSMHASTASFVLPLQFPRALRSSVPIRMLLALLDPQLPPGQVTQQRQQQQRGLGAAAGGALAAAAAAAATGETGPGIVGARAGRGGQGQDVGPLVGEGGLPTPEPDPEAVARLCAMGFGRAQAEAALRAAFNDEPTAVNRLLG